MSWVDQLERPEERFDYGWMAHMIGTKVWQVLTATAGQASSGALRAVARGKPTCKNKRRSYHDK